MAASPARAQITRARSVGQKARPLMAGAVIVIWFLSLSAQGLQAPFTSDDFMNLHGHVQRGVPRLLVDNITFYESPYRPLGGVFYAAFYRAFDLNPLPYRVACFVLLLINLWLCCRACLVTGISPPAAWAATLLAAYHAWFIDLYYSTGTVYEILCFAFYFLLVVFLFRLLYHDLTIEVDRRPAKTLGQTNAATYDAAFLFNGPAITKLP